MGRKSREKKERQAVEVKTSVASKKPLSSFLLKLIRLGIYLSLVTPLLVSSKFYFPFVALKGLYFMAVAEVVFFAWLLLIIYEKKYRPKINIISIALIIYLVVMTLSSVFGVNPSYSFWSKFERMSGLLMHFHLFGFFLVISSVFKEKKEWFKIFGVSIFIALLISFLTFLTKSGDFLSQYTAREGATLGNSSFLGSYLLFNAFIAVYLSIKAKNNLKIFSIVSLFLIVIALVFSGARTATLSFFGGISLIGLLYLSFVSKKKILRNIGKWSIIISLIIFIILGSLIFKTGSSVQIKFVEMATRARLVVWESAWKGIWDRPLLGYGPENFEFVFIKNFDPCMFLPECGSEIWFDRAHNILLDLLASVGILGLLSYFFVLFSVPLVLFKKFFKEKKGFWIASIFTALIIAYFIQNLTVFDMVSSYLMLFLIIGFTASVSEKEEDQEIQGKEKEINPFIITFLAGAFLLSFYLFVVAPTKTSTYAIESLKTTDNSKKIEYYQKSLEVSPMGRYQLRDFYGQKSLELLDNKNITKDQVAKELDFIVSELEKTRKESPLDFRAILKLGQVYNVYSLIDPQKIPLGESALREAISISPFNQQGYWFLSQNMTYQKRFDEALALAEKSIELNPKVFDSHSIAVQVSLAMKNEELAIEKIKNSLEINPEWIEKLSGLYKTLTEKNLVLTK